VSPRVGRDIALRFGAAPHRIGDVSSALFHAGQRHPPRTAARRLLWGIVTLLPLGAIAACLTVGAVLGWTGDVSMTDADRLWLTVFAAIFDLVFVLTLVVGTIRVTRQFAQERSTTPSS